MSRCLKQLSKIHTINKFEGKKKKSVIHSDEFSSLLAIDFDARSASEEMATMAAEGHFGCEGNEMKEERGCRMQVVVCKIFFCLKIY
jgi:hypothetical protein